MRALLWAALCALGLSGAGTATAAAEEGPRITVAGVGEARAEPDMATLRIGVETRGREADLAVAENSDTTAALIETLRGAGLTGDAVQTVGFSIHPLYERATSTGSPRGPRISGFSVENSILARIDEIDRVGPVLDAVAVNGATRIDSLTFGLKDRSAPMAEARADAVAEARAAAEAFAAAAGMALGPILEIHSGPGGSGPQPRIAAMSVREAVPIEAGSLTMSAQVSVVWALREASGGD